MQLNLMGKAHNLPLLRLNLTNVIMWHRHRSICKHTKAGMMTEFQDVSRSREGKKERPVLLMLHGATSGSNYPL